MKKGFTLGELLVVCVVLAVVLGFGVLFLSDSVFKEQVFEAKVIDKWTDLSDDGLPIYRIRTQSKDGEVQTFVSYYVHNKVSNGGYYKFTTRSTTINSVEPALEPQ